MDEDSAVARAADLTFDVEPEVADARPLKAPVVEPAKILSVATIVVLSPRDSVVVKVVRPLRVGVVAMEFVSKTRPPEPPVPLSPLLVEVAIAFALFGSKVPHWQIDWPADASLGAAQPELSCSHSKVGMVPS